MGSETVGSLLAAIALAINDGLRALMFADKRGWGPDEFEQVRALEEAMDQAKADFQAMSPLVSGQFFYESDRTAASLDELRALRENFQAHASIFKDWLRTGGPINPSWALETVQLRRDLHRAQCRAACRIFATGPGPARCLGAFQVRRRQRELLGDGASTHRGDAAEAQGMLRDPELGLEPPALPPPPQVMVTGARRASEPEDSDDDGRALRRGLEALVPHCNAVGKFERFGDRDVAFVCDYCDGFLVWEDLKSMPSTRIPKQPPPTPMSPTSRAAATPTTVPRQALPPDWQAMARSASSGEEKGIVFAPVAIANHVLPARGDWQARMLCPYCDEYTYTEDGEDDVGYAQDESGFPDVKTFQEHLEWYHAGMVPMPSAPTKKENCVVM